VAALPLWPASRSRSSRSFLAAFSLITFEPGSFLCRKGRPALASLSWFKALPASILTTKLGASLPYRTSLPSEQGTPHPLL